LASFLPAEASQEEVPGEVPEPFKSPALLWAELLNDGGNWFWMIWFSLLSFYCGFLSFFLLM
jgi:hypothetical protein